MQEVEKLKEKKIFFISVRRLKELFEQRIENNKGKTAEEVISHEINALNTKYKKINSNPLLGHAFSFEAEDDEDEDEENSDLIDFEFTPEELEKYEEMMELKKLERPNLFTSRKIKRRIPYVIYKEQIGLNNIYIQNGLFIIDITGKWMAENGVLGSLQKDNIHQALQKVLELQVD